ncbi:MAG TPA: hypothetical protein VF599_23860 [Pyrinomonadaceae bacterium]|jgi:hypothetical protein
MKTPKFFLAALILLVSFQLCFAQKTEVFDSFGELNCDDILARIDNFFYAIKKNPGAVGYAIIQGERDKTNFLQHEWWIYNNVESRRFDDSRLVVVRAEGDSEGIFTQFWLAPPGAEKPAYVEIKPDFTISENRKPFVFNSTAEANSPCPDSLQLKIYSDYLKANAVIRGHIVIFAKSPKEFQKQKSGVSTKLADKYKILPNQLRFFFVKKTDYSYIELWIVPRKKRN